jgi:hypothetical protein
MITSRLEAIRVLVHDGPRAAAMIDRTGPDRLAAHDLAEVQVRADHCGRRIGEAHSWKLRRRFGVDEHLVVTVRPQNAVVQRVHWCAGFQDRYGSVVISCRLVLCPQLLTRLECVGDG